MSAGEPGPEPNQALPFTLPRWAAACGLRFRGMVARCCQAEGRTVGFLP